MVAHPLWAVKAEEAAIVHSDNPDLVTDAELIADLHAAVAGGLLTSARVTQVLSLSQPSP